MSAGAKVVYIVSVIAVFIVSVIFLRGSAPAPPTGNIHIVSRLDEFTRSADPDVENTIPAFLQQPGSVGIIPADASGEAGAAEPPAIPVETVKPVNEAELRKAFCTPTLTRLIRQQYPGMYDDIADGDLVKQVLKTRPEYQDRVCVLPVWMPMPRYIVKYQVDSQALSRLAIPRTTLMWAAGITAAFAIALGVLMKVTGAGA